MSTVNTIYAMLKCPRCGNEVEQEIEANIGHGGLLLEFRIGDKVQWNPFAETGKDGRPSNGNLKLEGYVECAICHKDFFVKIVVTSDVINAVEVDMNRSGYIP